MSSQQNRYQIPDIDAVRQIFRTGLAEGWRFMVVMPDIDAKIGSRFAFSPNGGLSFSTVPRLTKPQIPNARAESIEVAPIQLDMDQRYGQASSINVPRKFNYGPITVNFYEDQFYNVTKYLLAWKSLISNEYKLFNPPTVYKKDLAVYAFDSVSNVSPIMMINFIECCPTVFVGGLNYSQAENGFLTISEELTIDNMNYEFL